MREFLAIRELPLIDGHKNLFIEFKFKLHGEVDRQESTYFGFLLYSPGPNDIERSIISGYGVMLTPLLPDWHFFENISIVDIPVRYPYIVVDSSLEVTNGASGSHFLFGGDFYQSLAKDSYLIQPDIEYNARLIINDSHNITFYIENEGEWDVVIQGPAHTPVNSIPDNTFSGYSAENHNFDYISIFAANNLDQASWGISDLKIKRYGDRKAYLVFDVKINNPDQGYVPFYLVGTQPPADEQGNIWEIKIKNPNIGWKDGGYIRSTDYSGDVAQKIIRFEDDDLYGDEQKRLVVGIANVVPDNVESPINLSFDFVSFQQDAPFIHTGSRFDIWVNHGELGLTTDAFNANEQYLVFGGIIKFTPSSGPLAWIDEVRVNNVPVGFKVIPDVHWRGSVYEKWNILVDNMVYEGDSIEVDYRFIDGIAALQSLMGNQYVSTIPVVKSYWIYGLSLEIVGEDLDEEAVSIAIKRFINKKIDKLFIGDLLYYLRNQGFNIHEINAEARYIDEYGSFQTITGRSFQLPNQYFRFRLMEATFSEL